VIEALAVCLQLLYGFLVQHFVELAGGQPPLLAHLDAMTPAIVATAAEVPFYAATLARARLGRAQQRLAAALKDPGYACMYTIVEQHTRPVPIPLAQLIAQQ
jgi:hypothetical protein